MDSIIFYGIKGSFHFFSIFIPYSLTIEKREKSHLLPCGNKFLPSIFREGWKNRFLTLWC
jgi:hypothetical protein